MLIKKFLAIVAIYLINIFKWRYSIVMFIYWLLMSLAYAIKLRSRIIQQFEHITQNNASIFDSFSAPDEALRDKNFDHLIFYLYYGLIIANLVFSMVNETHFKALNSESLQSKANLMSYLCFWWSNSLIKTGFKRDLTQEDLYCIDQSVKSEAITNRMDNEWSPKALLYLKQKNLNESNTRSIRHIRRSRHVSDDTPEENIELNQTTNNDTNKASDTKLIKASEPSLKVSLMKLYGLTLLSLACLKITHDILSFALPTLLDKLINFIKDKEQKNSVGYFYIFVLIFASFTQTLIMQHYIFGIFLMGQQIKIGLQNLIYRKSLRLSASARKETTVGEMVTREKIVLQILNFNFLFGFEAYCSKCVLNVKILTKR
jgi:hypothetical protein